MSPSQAYTLCMALALLTGLALRGKSDLAPRQRWGLALAAIAGSGIGSKLPFVIFGGEPFFSRIAWFGEGKTILSGLAGGYLAVELAKPLLGIRAKTGDGFAVPLAAGIAVGRWGCFFNG